VQGEVFTFYYDLFKISHPHGEGADLVLR